MDRTTLYAICWQDTHEPWGWAPATGRAFGEVPEDLLPEGPFFWDQPAAQHALARVLDWATGQALENLRERDLQRYRQDVERYESDVARGQPLPGVSVNVVGQVPPKWRPAEPRPRKTDEALRSSARELAEAEWSIQAYEVPSPTT